MIKYYFSKFRNILFLIIISVLFGLIRNIVLGRMLTKYDFGIYALSRTVIGLLYPILLFGQQRGLVRFFVSHKIEEYNWRKPISVLINISFVLSMIIVPSITWYYQMNSAFTCFCILAILSSIICELLSNLVRSSKKYELAIFLQRALRVILSILAIVFFLFDIDSLEILFIVFGITHIIYGFLLYYYVRLIIKSGNTKIPNYLFTQGLHFFLMDIAGLTYVYGVNIIIVGLISVEALGAFFAISIILRIFEMFTQSTDFIVMPASGELDYHSILSIIGKTFLIGVFLSLFFIVYGRDLLSILYNQKYDTYLDLIPYVAIIGLIKIIDVVPSSIISGAFNSKVLKRYLNINITLPVILIPLSIVLIRSIALKGAMVSLIVFYLLKVIFGYSIFINRNNSYLKTD